MAPLKKELSEALRKSYELEGPYVSSPVGVRMTRINTVAEQNESIVALEQPSIDQQNLETVKLDETDRQTNYGYITGVSCLSSEMKVPSLPLSDIDRREGDSNPSKTLGSLSESTKTPGNGPNGRHEFRVVETLLSNVFTKLSTFSDDLGRRLIFEVDWDYLDRKWEITHSTIKDVFMEKILAMSLQDQVINPSSEDSSLRSLQNDIEEELSTILDKSTLLPYLLEKDYEEEENNEDTFANFFTNKKTQINFHDKLDSFWDKRKEILKFIRQENALD